MSPESAWLVHHYELLTSTMDRAALLAHIGARERTAVVAVNQTAGRGRGGRPWQSSAGHAIACTIILRPKVPAARLTTLSLIAGVAVAEALEELSATPALLKWPNDVWLGSDPDHCKVAGILLTSHLSGCTVDAVLVGVGINVSTPRSELPAGGTSLLVATGLAPTHELVLKALLRHFDRGYTAFLASEGRPSLDAWQARAALLGKPVTIEDAGRQLAGVFTGIDDDGALLLVDANGVLRRVVAGDLTRGPRPFTQSG